MAHKIEFTDYSANTLTYLADGIQIDVTGEFNLKNGVYSHIHEFDDGEELTIYWLRENQLTIKNYPSNIMVFGYAEKYGINSIMRGSLNIDKGALIAICENDSEAVEEAFEQISDTFPVIDERDVKRDLKLYLSNFIEK